MSSISRWAYTDIATVWPSTGVTDHLNGGTKFGEPYHIKCCWEASSKPLTTAGGKEFIAQAVFYHEDGRVKDGDRIARGEVFEGDPLKGGGQLIKYHQVWSMTMFKSRGKPDIPDYRTAY